MQSTKPSEREHRPANQSLEPRSGDIEIPASQWTSFLDSFSLQHEGWLVTLLVTSRTDKSVKVRDARLERITAAEVNERSQIRVAVLADSKDRLIHQVSNPVGVTFKRNLSGAHEGLDITSADGSVTSLRFRMAAHPETLDGVLPDMGRTETKHSSPKAFGLRDQR
jgi:hypothetical protein